MPLKHLKRTLAEQMLSGADFYDQATDILMERERVLDEIKILETEEILSGELEISYDITLLLDRLEELDTHTTDSFAEIRDFLGAMESAEKRQRLV